MHPESTDVLVIGAGLAGMATAPSLPPHLRVAMLSKARRTIAPAPGRKAASRRRRRRTTASRRTCRTRWSPAPGCATPTPCAASRRKAPRRSTGCSGSAPFTRDEDGRSLHPDARGRPRRAPHRPRGRRHRAGHAALLRQCRARPNIRLIEHAAALDLLLAEPADAGATPALPRRTGARRRRRYHALAGQPYGAGDGRTGTGLCPDHQPRCRDRRRRGHGRARAPPWRTWSSCSSTPPRCR